ncbi:hypothetical protein E2C01_050106 [Portunus trituberculatus]|uniref:Uncharacterized protein n=1 Tax=Portunus trituberculatus TaxID=210409 RepID=A0A5B7GFM2_PORTR|nr:hypothetical protein [Portunus trituberculatus]
MINGPMGLDGHDETTMNSHVTTTTAQNQRKHLDHQVNPLWELNVINNSDDPVSVKDKRVAKLWLGNVVQVDGHYQFPIPFRNKNPDLPDNKEFAERQLESLRRRLASRNIYIDDPLHSVESPGKATIVIHRLRKLLQKGGSRLTKLSCNQKRVLREVPKSEKAMGVKEILLGDKLPME